MANNRGLPRVMIDKYEMGEVVPSIDAAKKISGTFEVSLAYLGGEGQNAKFDKKTVQRLQNIEALNPTIKDRLFFLIDTVIRKTNAQKVYMR